VTSQDQLDAIVARIAPAADPGRIAPQTTENLMQQIMTTPPARGSAPVSVNRRRWLVGVPAAAAIGAAAILGAGLLTPAKVGPVRVGPPNAEAAALTFVTKGKYLIVRVKDPLADPQRYRREFAAHGLKITLLMVPASPSIVGTVVSIAGDIQAITAQGACESGGGGDMCAVGVKIPLDFHGSGQVAFGRAARPGETYVSSAPATAPGEVLHGLIYRNHTVADVLSMLARRHVTVPQWRCHPGVPTKAKAIPNPCLGGRPAGQVPRNWYVIEASPWAANQVLLIVSPVRPGPA
jgi:hypothetical protein